MTRDEIKLPPYLCASYEGDDLFTGDQLVEVVRAAVLAEREACARVADKQNGDEEGDADACIWSKAARHIAAAIRARGQE